MRGLMMNRPLLISSLLEHGAAVYHEREIVSRTVEGPVHRYTLAEAHRRTRQLANALAALGVKAGDRIGTIAWNGYRHFELYFAVSGMGAVCHTMNPRLHPSQLVYVVNHAEDALLFVDLTFVPLVEAVAEHLKPVRGIVIMTDRAHMPQTKLANALCYEDLVLAHSDVFSWPEFDEDTASSLCYTSGTTGNPKGVLYSHRSTVLHTLAISLPDCLGLGEREAVLPVVPMFHVNAWGLPYATTMTGAKLVFPGPRLDGASLTELLTDEAVTIAAGVPTVWINLLQYWQQTGGAVPSLHTVVIGGSAAPRSMIEMFQEQYGIAVLHAWGMTETSPLGSVSRLKPSLRDAGQDVRYRTQLKQGRPPFGIEMEIVDEQNRPVPRDGHAFGELKVRGPWVCSGYYRLDQSPAHAGDGWFATGDIATIDADGYMQITDRSKDVIKSGGEWISSIDLENAAAGHPDVLQAAVIGVPHPKWSERPLLLVVPKPGTSPTKESVLEFLRGKVAEWWLPDDVVFEKELPIGATGKVQKSKLRERYTASSG